MNRPCHPFLLAMLAAAALCIGACGDDPSALTGRANNAGDDNGANPDDPNAAPGALECTVKPEGRSYVLFDGTKLEAKRTNENVGVNRARVKPFGVMRGEYQRVLGLVPASLAASAGSFDEAPSRWFAEARHSGISLNAVFGISFEACSAYALASPELAAMPTADSAASFCTSLIRKAWSRTPAPEEISACQELATSKLDAEPDARRRWSYVCSSILSSSQFLTF